MFGFCENAAYRPVPTKQNVKTMRWNDAISRKFADTKINRSLPQLYFSVEF